MRIIKSIANGDLDSAKKSLGIIINSVSPETSEKGLQRVRESVINFTDYEDFADYVMLLVAKIRVYHVEFLAWKDDFRYAVLALEAINCWESK